jgi:hypothetical protein
MTERARVPRNGQHLVPRDSLLSFTIGFFEWQANGCKRRAWAFVECCVALYKVIPATLGDVV